MVVVVYSLCAFTSALCLGLVLREYFRNRAKLLLWVSLCFYGLFLSNVVLILDRFVVPEISLVVYRVIPALLGFGALIYGLTREAE
jgi:hypothetical protein